MAFKLSLALDVRQWLKGTADVEKSLDDVGDTLNELARDTAQDADKAADSLSREFSDAFDKVKADAKRTGDAIGDDVKRGAQEASEGTHTFKENAASNAKEVAASFDGSAESIADGFQGLAAEALEGFGPAGLAAGVAVAAGIGIASAALQQSAEDAEEAREAAMDLASGIRSARTEAEGLADAMGDALQETIDTRVFGFFGEQTTRLELYNEAERELGLNHADILKAMAGDDDAYNRVVQTAWANSDEAHDEMTTNFISDLNKQNNASKEATRWNQEYADSGVEAQQRMAEAAADFSDSLTDNLSVADEGLNDFVKKGKLSLEKWSKELERRQRENARIQNFTVDIAPKLSEEALENFAQLPVETQAQIEKAYRTGSKKDKKTIVANLEAEAKVSKVDINTKEADKAAASNPVEVPVTVNSSGMSADVVKASNEGQAEADKTANVIEFKTKIDRDDLQRQVDRAAASIHPPTIYVKTKAQKDVP